jgi:hypothetical protein
VLQLCLVTEIADLHAFVVQRRPRKICILCLSHWGCFLWTEC